MIVAVSLAVLFALGLDIRRIAVLATAVYLPVVAGCIALMLIWRLRPDDTTRSAVFCDGVASELRAGASLRSAVVDAATATGVSRASLRGPMDAIAMSIGEAFPEVGDELRLTVTTLQRLAGVGATFRPCPGKVRAAAPSVMNAALPHATD